MNVIVNEQTASDHKPDGLIVVHRFVSLHCTFVSCLHTPGERVSEQRAFGLTIHHQMGVSSTFKFNFPFNNKKHHE